MKREDLTPPDYKRCQCVQQTGSFMTLGPRSWIRCSRPPVWLAVEIVAGADGQHGAMSMCDECAKVMLDMAHLRARVQLQPILKTGDT